MPKERTSIYVTQRQKRAGLSGLFTVTLLHCQRGINYRKQICTPAIKRLVTTFDDKKSDILCRSVQTMSLFITAHYMLA
jgi:hypothetical protein